MDVRLPDGTIVRGVPDGTTQEQLLSKLKANGISVALAAAPSAADSAPVAASSPDGEDRNPVLSVARLATPAGVVSELFTPEGRKNLGNAVAGMVRGAGSIGATLVDAARKTGKDITNVVPANMRPDATSGLAAEPTGQDLRSGMDEALRTAGADTESPGFQAGKLASEVAGTYPIGGVTGKAVGAVAPRLGQAIASGGFSTGTRVAPGIAPQAADLALRVAGGAINGGLTAGAVNPEDAGVGAAIGGALPPLTKVAGAVGRAVGSAISPRVARTETVSKIGEALGGDTPQVVADIQTFFPRGAENIPVSSAAATKNATLAGMEQGSRLRNSPEWHAFDVNQSKAAYGNVMDATQEAADLGALKQARRDNWDQAWQAASANMKPRLWRQRMTQFGADLGQAAQSPESSNPAVRQVLDAINAEMDRLGPNFGIGNLQQLRANLNGKVQPMSPDVFKSAPRDNPAIISLKQEMDDILNTATGGKWQKVIEGYAKDSEAVHAAAAAQRVRNAYTDAQTGRIVSPVIATDVPQVTAANLNRAMNAARMPDKSLALSPQANQKLEATLDVLRRQGMVQEVKRAASAGGGSDTVSNALASGVAQKTPSMVAQLIGAVRQIGMGRKDQAMADLLSHPDELAAALERWLRPPQVSPAARLAYRAAPAIAADQ